MEKSHPIAQQEDVRPSAPPNYLNQSSIHQQGFIHQPLQSGFHNGNQQQPGSTNNTGFQSVVVQHPTNTSPIINPTQYDLPETYCRKLYKNRRQTGSISGGLLLMLVSGLHIGWGIWRVDFWPIRTNTSLRIFTVMVWPLGAIFGGFIGSALVPILRKNIIYYITALTMSVGNVLLIIWDEQYAAIVFGRLFTSLAHGMVFIALISQAGENASNNMRGTILSTINCMMYTAVFISAHVTGFVQLDAQGRAEDFSAERILGIIALIFIMGSMICTLTVTVETVPYLLLKNKPNVATEAMKYLRDELTETPQISREMEELTLMIAQDEQNNAKPFSNRNGKPLILIIMIRLMAALTNNFCLNFVLIRFCELIIDNRQLVPLVLIAPRLAMSIGQIFYADFFGRKTHIIVSSMLAGLSMIGLGIVINTLHLTRSYNYYVPALFSIWFQLFCSIGIDQMADVCLSEAFSTAKKPWSLSFVMSIEHIFHIFMIGMAFTIPTTLGQISALIFITGIFIVIFGLILLFILPETKGSSLKQSRDLYRNEKLFHIMNYWITVRLSLFENIL